MITTPNWDPCGAARTPLRAAAVTILCALVMIVAAAPAAAHTALESTSPADGATVKLTPASIQLRFDGAVVPLGTRVLVTGPDGDATDGQARVSDQIVTQPLRRGAAPGRYTVDWRVSAADGHPIEGSLAFTSSSPGATSPPAITSPPAVTSAPAITSPPAVTSAPAITSPPATTSATADASAPGTTSATSTTSTPADASAADPRPADQQRSWSALPLVAVLGLGLLALVVIAAQRRG